MASLLQDPLYEAQHQAPSPRKDLVNIVVTQKEVSITSWTVSLRADYWDKFPRTIRKTHSEFLSKEAFALHGKIRTTFGNDTLEYIMNICRGHIDFLVRLPDKLKIHILSFLAEDDIQRVADTCKTFYTLCNSDKFWEEIKSKQENRKTAYSARSAASSRAKSYDRTHFPVWMIRRKTTWF
ncbi:F-box only protein 36-like [Bombina bombina]|uniref:F-box only protein 36-like n=1 Tax=Bombina bombina TaxID=8345 RepID=UPI00235AC7FC|nr:F-box only protein 36-like [Bombina bombina]